jgi:hypothetical protein
MNAEQASKYKMRKLTCREFRESCYCEGDERSVFAVPPGYWRQHAYEGRSRQHGKPHHAAERESQSDAREGQAECDGVAERLVRSVRPSNVGGEKGPQFRANVRSSEGQEIGQPINSD